MVIPIPSLNIPLIATCMSKQVKLFNFLLPILLPKVLSYLLVIGYMLVVLILGTLNVLNHLSLNASTVISLLISAGFSASSTFLSNSANTCFLSCPVTRIGIPLICFLASHKPFERLLIFGSFLVFTNVFLPICSPFCEM